MGLTVNILTSGFLVTVIIFFVLIGILFYSAWAKMGQVLEEGDSENNDLELLDSALNSVRVAYILAFIAAALTFILAILYAGHETVIKPSEYIHMVIYLATYVLLIISIIYAYIALGKLYDVKIKQRNGADAFIWAGLLMSIFAFIGLTATSTGRLGMNIVRSKTEDRVASVESKINEHLPAIRGQVDKHLNSIHSQVEATKEQVDRHLPTVRNKVDELHTQTFGKEVFETSSCPSGKSGVTSSLASNLGSGGIQTGSLGSPMSFRNM
jgi:hypothetical protein